MRPTEFTDSFALRVSHLLSHNWKRPHWRIVFLHDVPSYALGPMRQFLEYFSARFQWVSLEEGLRRVLSCQIGCPCITLTFDDAHKSLVNLMPLLRDAGVTACVYVVPEYVEAGRSLSGRRGEPIMSWQDLEAWLAAGHEVGSHSLSHPALPRCSDEELRRQFVESRRRLETALGRAVEHFAYPFGQLDGRTQRLVRQLKCYRSVATSYRGAMYGCHDPLFLRRNRIDLQATPARNEMWMRLADRFYWLRAVKKLIAKPRSKSSSHAAS